MCYLKLLAPRVHFMQQMERDRGYDDEQVDKRRPGWIRYQSAPIVLKKFLPIFISIVDKFLKNSHWHEIIIYAVFSSIFMIWNEK